MCLSLTVLISRSVVLRLATWRSFATWISPWTSSQRSQRVWWVCLPWNGWIWVEIGCRAYHMTSTGRLTHIYHNHISKHIISIEIHKRNKLHTYVLALSRMENLHTMWLQRNELEFLPDNICYMRSLDTLVLSNNKLHDIPSMMEDMNNLRWVPCLGVGAIGCFGDEWTVDKQMYWPRSATINLIKVGKQIRKPGVFNCIYKSFIFILKLAKDFHQCILYQNKLIFIHRVRYTCRFVNFRDNPLTYEVELPAAPKKSEDEEEDDREMFGRDFMRVYCQEARKRVNAMLNMHRVNRMYQQICTWTVWWSVD